MQPELAATRPAVLDLPSLDEPVGFDYAGQAFPRRDFKLAEATISSILVPGAGRPVVLLHGNSSCKEVWTHQISLLRAHGRPVLAPDLPGHGQSSDARTPNATYSFPGYAAVLGEMLEQLGWHSVDFVGWSLGGHIGLELYATSHRIRSLAIVGTPPVRLAPDIIGQAFYDTPVMRLAGKQVFSGDEARSYAAGMLGDESLVTPLFARNVLRTDGNARHHMFNNTLNGIGIDERRAVETLTKPLCVIHGEKEPFVRLGYLRSIDYRALWNGQIYVMKSSGHAPHIQHPQEFNKILLSFLEFDKGLNRMA